MTWFRVLVCTAGVLLASQAHAGDLTTRDLLELHRAGIGDEVLVALVEADGGPFDLASVELIELKADGLSDRVLAALVRVGRPSLYDPYPHAPAQSADTAYGWTHTAGTWLTHTVAVPVFVPVPVFVTRKPGRGAAEPGRGERGRHATDESPYDVTELQPGPPGTAGTARPVRSPTVDQIRHAPRGFHPGNIGPRSTQPASATAPAPARGRQREQPERPDP